MVTLPVTSLTPKVMELREVLPVMLTPAVVPENAVGRLMVVSMVLLVILSVPPTSMPVAERVVSELLLEMVRSLPTSTPPKVKLDTVRVSVRLPYTFIKEPKLTVAAMALETLLFNDKLPPTQVRAPKSMVATPVPLFRTVALLPTELSIGREMLITLGLLVTSRLPVPGQAEPTLKRLGREISVKEELLSLAFVEPIFKLPPTVVRLHKASRLVGLLPTTLKSRIVRLPPTEVKYCKLHRSVMGSPPGASVPVAELPLPSRVRLPVMVVYRHPPGPVKAFRAV